MKTFEITIGGITATILAYNMVTAIYNAKRLLKAENNSKIQVKIVC